MASSNERIASRIRSKSYGPEVDSFVKDLATALASQGRLASDLRGIFAGVIANESGGTTLDVGDPSAGRQSKSLQAPQKGLPAANGALGVRMQANVEQQTKMIPATVAAATFVTKDMLNYAQVDVILAADVPYIIKDGKTGQNVASGNPYNQLAAAGPITRITMQVPTSTTLPTVGSVVNVSKTTQYDVRTIWVNKEGRRVPIVNRTPTDNYALTGFMAGGSPITTCTPLLLTDQALDFLFHAPFPPDPPSRTGIVVSLLPWHGAAKASPDSYWRLIEFSVVTTYGHQGGPLDHYPWMGAGRIDGTGALVGLPDNYTSSALIDWDISFSSPPSPPSKLYEKTLELQTGCGGIDGLVHWHSDTALFHYNTTSPTSDFPP